MSTVSEQLHTIESTPAPAPSGTARDADLLLSRLEVASLSLARADGERDIFETLGRAVLGLLDGDGVIVCDPDLDRGTLRVLVHHARGVDEDVRTVPAGDSLLIQVARSGEPQLSATPSNALTCCICVDSRVVAPRDRSRAHTHARPPTPVGARCMLEPQRSQNATRAADVLRAAAALLATRGSLTRAARATQSDALAGLRVPWASRCTGERAAYLSCDTEVATQESRAYVALRATIPQIVLVR